MPLDSWTEDGAECIRGNPLDSREPCFVPVSASVLWQFGHNATGRPSGIPASHAGEYASRRRRAF
ncbi:hypothetical protein HVPorG_04919 [Roseomonas mucosa]|nr:hypothetical protein HVPorG_04919 [Roseomonas mucosa]